MPKYKNPFLLELKARSILETLSWQDFLKKIENVTDDSHKALLITQYLVGARPAEICYIVRERVEIEKHHIKMKIRTIKGGFERLVMFPICNEQTEFLADFFKKKIFPKEYLFTHIAKYRNPRDKFLRLNTEYSVGEVVKGKFYPYTFYFFRHNIASILFDLGLGEKYINFYFGKPLLPKTIAGSSTFYVHGSRRYALEVAKYLKKVMS